MARSYIGTQVTTIRQNIKRGVFDRFFHRCRLYVLNYHLICGPGEESYDEFGICTPFKQFRANVEKLANRYRFVSIHDWLTNAELIAGEGHYVAISFDDGHESVFEHALPILEEFDAPATLFVNSAYWDGNRRVCWSSAEGSERLLVSGRDMTLTEAVRIARSTQDLSTYCTMTQAVEDFVARNERIGRGYLSFEDLRAETSDLIDIGMHGHFHHRHIMFDKTWQTRNIRVNMETLQGLKNYVPLYAFPFGTVADVNAESIALCKECGLVPIFHNGGYNVPHGTGIRRIAGDRRDAVRLIESQSPFLHKYDIW